MKVYWHKFNYLNKQQESPDFKIDFWTLFTHSSLVHFSLQVAPLGGQGATPAPSFRSDCLSSDPEPKFELKGLTFPFAPPLSSDSTFSDVYTSDKLNFL